MSHSTNRLRCSTRERKPSTLSRSGGLFGGLRKDVVGRLPFYWSDFRDALNFQCITSVVFMFFACFAPAITFGGLMGTSSFSRSLSNLKLLQVLTQMKPLEPLRR
jgi:hypothetical protein